MKKFEKSIMLIMITGITKQEVIFKLLFSWIGTHFVCSFMKMGVITLSVFTHMKLVAPVAKAEHPRTKDPKIRTRKEDSFSRFQFLFAIFFLCLI